MAISQKRRLTLYQAMNGRCGYCGRDIAFKDMQIDHMNPQSAPSLSTYLIDGKKVNRTHHDSNLMPSCASCNHYKRDMTVDGFRRTIKNLHARLAKNYIVKVAHQFSIVHIVPFDGLFYFEKLRKIN
ncbi:HNH endonuclease [Spirosoma arboris]|uniref:HNH endonuclease n=1 Tax=Spirosoma arboris TaxID=2682092 RepID=UPI0018DD2C3C|nr:HNH endonuclease [Spirosoma arboris]